MRQAILALLLTVGLVVLMAYDARAANPCIECQNKCLSKIKQCEKTHRSQVCYDRYGEAYGACKVACKGSAVCMGECRPVKGNIRGGKTWHGAKCYSKGGCHCTAMKCTKAPYYRNAKCFSAPG